MAEQEKKQEKKQEKISYNERLAKVMQSMKGKPLPTDTEDPFTWDMKPVPGRFGKNSKGSE